MNQTLANVSTRILTQRVNRRLKTKSRESYISRVKHGKAGSASLKDVVNQEVIALLEEARAARIRDRNPES